MPESATPVQHSLTVIEIRPFKGGWQCYEGPGVGPYWIGDTAKKDAIGYASARAKFGSAEVRAHPKLSAQKPRQKPAGRIAGPVGFKFPFFQSSCCSFRTKETLGSNCAVLAFSSSIRMLSR